MDKTIQIVENLRLINAKIINILENFGFLM